VKLVARKRIGEQTAVIYTIPPGLIMGIGLPYEAPMAHLQNVKPFT
jgi:hypothetical protein